MASPPITIGELIDVPAPLSPINAQFMQEIANRIVHRFASLPAMDAWAAANGSVATVAGVLYHRVGGAWVALATAASVTAASAAATAADAVVAATAQDGIEYAIWVANGAITEPWQTIAANPGAWSGSCLFKKIGNSVAFQFQATMTGFGVGLSIAVLPVGYRPFVDLYYPVADTTNGVVRAMTISTAGVVGLAAPTVAGDVGHVFVANVTIPI